MPRWKHVHLIVGVIGLFLFLLSGQYMHFAHSHLDGMPPAPRLLYRSAHIYLLWSSLLNFLLGCYLEETRSSGALWIQKIGSTLILISPFLLCLAFFYEPSMKELARPFSRTAIYLSALGVVMHGFTSLRARAI